MLVVALSHILALYLIPQGLQARTLHGRINPMSTKQITLRIAKALATRLQGEVTDLGDNQVRVSAHGLRLFITTERFLAADGDRTFTLTVDGERDGRDFRFTVHHDLTVSGEPRAQAMAAAAIPQIWDGLHH